MCVRVRVRVRVCVCVCVCLCVCCVCVCALCLGSNPCEVDCFVINLGFEVNFFPYLAGSAVLSKDVVFVVVFTFIRGIFSLHGSQ